METGLKYKKVDYSKYIVSKFSPTLFSLVYRTAGCGATALATLTGINPYKFISPDKKNASNWPDQYLITTLRKSGYKVIPIKKLEVTNHESVLDNLTKDHIILVSQLYNKFESSWAVIYGGLYIHNNIMIKLDALEFVNRPIVTAYLLFHEKFK